MSTSAFENCGCTTMDMPECKEMTKQIHWRAKQPSEVACFSEDLKCWGAWDTTCGHKAKDTTPSIAWRREAWKEEALDDLPWKDERGLSSIRRTLEPFQRWHWQTFWETEWSAYGLFRAHRYHLELNWTEPNRTHIVIIHNEIVCSHTSSTLAAVCVSEEEKFNHLLTTTSAKWAPGCMTPLSTSPSVTDNSRGQSSRWDGGRQRDKVAMARFLPSDD